MRPDEMLYFIRHTKMTPEVLGRELRNRTQLVRELRAATALPGLRDIAQRVLNWVPNPDAPGDVAQLDDNGIAHMAKFTSEINMTKNLLVAFLVEHFGEDEGNIVYLRLPDAATHAPAQFDAAFQDLAVGLDSLTRRVTGEGLAVGGVRHGSIWLQLLAEQAAYGFVVGFMGVVAYATRLYLDLETQRARTKTTKSHADLVQALNTANEDLIREAVTQLVAAHQAPEVAANLQENVLFAVRQIERLHQLSLDGARLVLSTKASPATKALLPRQFGGKLDELPDAPQAQPAALPEGKPPHSED